MRSRSMALAELAACRPVNQPRGTQRNRPTPREDEDQLTQAIIALASQYGRYGYRRITALLKHGGWQVGKDRLPSQPEQGAQAIYLKQRR